MDSVHVLFDLGEGAVTPAAAVMTLDDGTDDEAEEEVSEFSNGEQTTTHWPGHVHVDDILPPCPDHMQGPISFQRMVDPVMASDGFTYERSKIEQWLRNGNRASPMTRKEMNITLTPNQSLKTLIQEWIEENTSLRGLRKQLKALHGPLVMASSPKEVLDAIVMIGELVTRSKSINICILSPNGVEKMKRLLFVTEGNLSEEVTNALNTLKQQCIANVFELREKYAYVLQQRMELQKAKEVVLGVGGGGGTGNKLKNDVAAAEKTQATAQTKFDALKIKKSIIFKARWQCMDCSTKNKITSSQCKDTTCKSEFRRFVNPTNLPHPNDWSCDDGKLEYKGGTGYEFPLFMYSLNELTRFLAMNHKGFAKKANKKKQKK